MAQKISIVLVSEKNGKSYSVKLHPGLLLLILLTALGGVLAAIVSSTGYIMMLKRHNDLLSSHERLAYEVQRLRQDYHDRSTAAQPTTAKPTVSDVPAASVQDNEPPRTAEQAGGAPSALALDAVTVENLPDGEALQVSFKLINRAAGTRISGYLFVIAHTTESIPPVFKSWPDAVLEGGTPRDFRQGSFFSITQYKRVTCRIEQAAAGIPMNRVTIVLYSKSGSRVLQQEYSTPSRRVSAHEETLL